MKLLKTTVYVGPNIYEHMPLIRMTVDMGRFEGRSIRSFGADLIDGLLDVMPTLKFETTSAGDNLLEMMQDSDDFQLGELMARLALFLQRRAAATVSRARAIETDERGVIDVLFGYDSRDIGIRAGDVARLTILELIDPIPEEKFDIAAEIEDFVDYAVSHTLGPSSTALVNAADERGIPWFRLNNDSLIQLGHGKYQKRIEAALSCHTSLIGFDIAKDKEFCLKLLGDLGLPVPLQYYARNKTDAVEAAKDIGYPVVVKPIDGNHGRGVSLNLKTATEVREAFALAKEEGNGVVVEEMIEGLDHRLLVIDGKLVAAAKRVPAHVIGDGKSTVGELVDEVNRDPRRGMGHENMLTQIKINAGAKALLKQQKLKIDSVPDEGEEVFLRKTANLSTGGTAIDVTDIIHPENKVMAERAVKAVGLDIGGVDFLTTDISRSYREIGGGICEVNAGPGIRMHIAPSEGEPRDVGGAVIDMLYPPGEPFSIPVAALTGTNGKTTTSRMLAHILKMAGMVVGQTSTDAVKIDGTVTVKGDMTGPVAAKIVLRDPDVDIAVLETARGGIVRAGLGYKKCDVGAVLNVSADHLGLGGVDTLEDLARVKRLVVEVAEDTAVLNADNPYTLQMAAHTPAKHICYVTLNPNNPLVQEHIELGKRAIVLEQTSTGDAIVLYDHGQKIHLLWSHLIPATIDGKARHNVENAMFAAAMAYSMDLATDQIRAGLRTFDNSFYQSPGRMNVYDGNGFRVILDYGHNEAAVSAMVDLVERLDPIGKRIVCLTCPGDRRDEDAEAIARCAAGKFDTYICHMDQDLRGRAADEIPKLMRDELIRCGVTEKQIEIVPDEMDSVQLALDVAERSDLVLIFCAAVEEAWNKITHFTPQDEEEKAPVIEANGTTGKSIANGSSEFEVPEGFTLVRDERGVRLEPDV
ncbi:MAG: cyanophycin synthetase [Pseudomonadota bacterium]